MRGNIDAIPIAYIKTTMLLLISFKLKKVSLWL